MMMMTVYSHLMSVVNTKRSHSERQVNGNLDPWHKLTFAACHEPDCKSLYYGPETAVRQRCFIG